ncbi:MAG TPA: ATP-binding protein [Syntrophorhabdaceae bacterium]
MIHGSSSLTVTSELSYLPAIQAFAREFARETGFGSNDQEMIVLALEEAVTNVIEHAFESTEQSFQIIFEPSAGGMEIIVKDMGLPYDLSRLPEYEAPTDVEEILSKGLGSFIMAKCVDEVFLCNLGKGGKELHLIKRLPARSVVELGEYPEPPPSLKPIADKAVPDLSLSVELRLMKSSEALEVSRLFYRTYGYSYLSDVMYYPERLAEYNQEGLITSVVAVSEEGEIVGHLAMTREKRDDIVAETGKGAVKPSFRGKDIFTGMQRLLNDTAKNMGIRALYGRSVTVHSATQKMTEKTGYKDCGVVLGYAPADIAFKGIQEQLSQRESLVYCFQPVLELPVTSVFLPSHHEPVLRRIYSNLGLTRNFHTSSKIVPMADLSVMEVKVYSEINSAEIVIRQHGEDVIRVLRDHLRDLCAKRIDHFTLFLDLGDPATILMCEEIEKLGFFMGGIIPCLHFEDTLILQYLNNLIIDPSRIKLHSPMAKEIVAYVNDRIGGKSGTAIET